MALVNIVLALALAEYLYFGFAVGRARERYGIKAPAITGHQTFECYYRVQMNTLELLIAFVPALWLFAYYVSAQWAAVLGAVFIVGRLVYFRAYVSDPSKRNLGFLLSILPVAALIVGGLIGATRAAWPQ
jgi:glutathione S-transferase